MLEETEIVHFDKNVSNSFSIRMQNKNGSILSEKIFFENEYHCHMAKRQFELAKQKLIQDKHLILSKLLDVTTSVNNLTVYECIEIRKKIVNAKNGESSQKTQSHETEQTNKTLNDFD